MRQLKQTGYPSIRGNSGGIDGLNGLRAAHRGYSLQAQRDLDNHTIIQPEVRDGVGLGGGERHPSEGCRKTKGERVHSDIGEPPAE